MLDLIREVLDYERDRLLEYKHQGLFVIRPSSVLLILFVLFYCLSTVDIVPESLVNPVVVGYIDDLILMVFVLAYTYKDWSVLRGIREIQSSDLQVTRDSGEGQVPSRDRSETGDNPGRRTVPVGRDMSSASSVSSGDIGDDANDSVDNLPPRHIPPRQARRVSGGAGDIPRNGRGAERADETSAPGAGTENRETSTGTESRTTSTRAESGTTSANTEGATDAAREARRARRVGEQYGTSGNTEDITVPEADI